MLWGNILDFEIAQLQNEHLSEVQEFLRQAYPEEQRKSDVGYSRWFYGQNPNAEAGRLLPVWAVRTNRRIVGQLGTIPVQLKIGTRYCPAIWLLEFLILEEFRGKGLGKQLVLAANEKYPTMITLGINEASTRVFTKLGWNPMGRIHRYHKLLFAGTAAGLSRGLREALNWTSFPLHVSSKQTRPTNQFEIRQDQTVGSELDELWESASRQWPVAVRRDQKTVEWQFLKQPGKVYEVIRLYRRGKLAGYAIVFFRKGRGNEAPPKAAISDLVYDFTEPDEIIDQLLSAAVNLAIERRAGSLVTDFLDARIETHLKKHGFWRIKNSPPFMASAVEGKELLYNPQNWYLTRADADISVFEEPNVRQS